MKYHLTFLLAFALTLFCFSLFGQQQSLTVVKLKNGSTIIECKKVLEESGTFGSNETDIGNYWITGETNVLLQNGLKKAINWAKLNEEHKKEFEKEIIRIRITDKDVYEFYKKYISEFSKEAKLVFQGHEDGSFTLYLTITQDTVDITLVTADDIDNFIKMLQGKSVNKEIDEIFKN